MSYNREIFIKDVYAETYQLAKDEGIPHDFIMAQVIQETGWGQHILEGTNNIFNIKADSSWEGEKSTHKVWEIEHGERVWVDDDFRKYDNYGESVSDWLNFLHENKRYEALFEEKNLSTEEFAQRIQDAGYATDPNYAQNIVNITHGRTYTKLIEQAKESYEKDHLPNNSDTTGKSILESTQDIAHVSIYPGEQINIDDTKIHSVVSGDTFFKIAQMNGMTNDALLVENKWLIDKDRVKFQEPKIVENQVELGTSNALNDENIINATGVEISIKELNIVKESEIVTKEKDTQESSDMPPWMTVAINQAKEIGGRNEHQVDAIIRKYHKEGAHLPNASASTAWCASFVSWALKEGGMKDTPQTAGSRFFRDESENTHFGHGLKPIPKGEEKLGDIAVWADLDKNGEHKGSGHVAFVFGKDAEGDNLFLGGNQGDTLGVKEYSTEKEATREFVGYFRPEEAENTYEPTDLLKYSSVAAANQAAIGQEMEIGDSTR